MYERVHKSGEGNIEMRFLWERVHFAKKHLENERCWKILQSGMLLGFDEDAQKGIFRLSTC
jgi:hypothetical protein